MEPTSSEMNKSVIVWVVVIVVIVLGGWYWSSTGDKQSQTQETAQIPAQTVPEAAPLTLALGTSDTLGNYFVAKNGMTLYRYTKDTKGKSNCYGTCAENWPPYSLGATEIINASSEIMAKMGSISRTDGITQLTYDGVPLYFWKDDIKPGDTTGQNVGGVWFIVQP